MSELSKKGFTCECGKYHEFSAYVYAHWDTPLTHACDCGRKHKILHGRVQLTLDTPKPKRTRKAKTPGAVLNPDPLDIEGRTRRALGMPDPAQVAADGKSILNTLGDIAVRADAIADAVGLPVKRARLALAGLVSIGQLVRLEGEKYRRPTKAERRGNMTKKTAKKKSGTKKKAPAKKTTGRTTERKGNDEPTQEAQAPVIGWNNTLFAKIPAGVVRELGGGKGDTILFTLNADGKSYTLKIRKAK